MMETEAARGRPFTRVDVERHRHYAKIKRHSLTAVVEQSYERVNEFVLNDLRDMIEWHESMADRIEALVSPGEGS